MDKWKGRGKKWTLAKAQELDTSSIAFAKMTVQEKAELAQFYYNQFNLRVESYAKALTVPYAFSHLMESFKKQKDSVNLTDLQRSVSLENPVVVPKGKYRTLNYPFSEMKSPVASLNSYIRRMQSFFEAKTSTVKGWRDVGNQQDVSLFGGYLTGKYHYEKDDNGKRHRVYEVVAKESLSDADRVKLWSIIDLAKDAGWYNRFGYDSGQAHKDIAQLWQSGNWNVNDIDEAYNKILDILEVQKEDREYYLKKARYNTDIELNPTKEAGERGDNLDGDLFE